ncbi:MAG: response regulator transcription factor, partial [Planctomycetota bacterium]
MSPTGTATATTPEVVVVSARPKFASAVEAAVSGLASVVTVTNIESGQAWQHIHPGVEVLALDDFEVVNPEGFVHLVTTARAIAQKFAAFLVTDCWGLSGLGPDQVQALTRTLRAQYCAFQRAPRAIARFLSERRYVEQRPRKPGDEWIRAGIEQCRRRLALTAQEVTITEAVICGSSNKDVARDVGISISTVRTHILHVFKKFGVTSRAELSYRVFGDVYSDEVTRGGPDAGRPAALAGHCLIVCEAAFPRAQAVRALAQASIEGLTVDRATAFSLLKHDVAIDAIILDVDIEP